MLIVIKKNVIRKWYSEFAAWDMAGPAVDQMQPRRNSVLKRKLDVSMTWRKFMDPKSFMYAKLRVELSVSSLAFRVMIMEVCWHVPFWNSMKFNAFGTDPPIRQSPGEIGEV
jgi:hypothetical protein